MYYLLLYQGDNGFTNALECYVCTYIAYLGSRSVGSALGYKQLNNAVAK